MPLDVVPVIGKPMLYDIQAILYSKTIVSDVSQDAASSTFSISWKQVSAREVSGFAELWALRIVGG